MSAKTKHRYMNSFFITTVLYLVASFFLFYVFADTLVVQEKRQEERKISLNHVSIQQEPTPLQPVQEVQPEPEPIVEKKPEPIVEKKKDKPKPIKEKHHEHKKHHEKKPIKEPIKEQIVEKTQETIQTKQEVVENVKPVEKAPISNEVVTKQVDSTQLQNLENAYLSKVRNLIEKNKVYPKVAKRLNQTGKVYVTFVITKDGEVKNCRIHKSSRFESLDNASIEILLKIANFEAIPEELNKNSWEITVPIVYQLSRN